LSGFDRNLSKAAANLGAGPVKTFFSIQMPLILPGMVSGGLFAFITSFDEVVVVLFLGTAETQTLPWQMFNGLTRTNFFDNFIGGYDARGIFYIYAS
jgi:putative spermidine/putrescine transport system permease protein